MLLTCLEGCELKQVWRLLDTGPRTAAENMALDEVLLECRAMGVSPNTFRLLRFKPPAVLVGYHQDATQEVRLDYVEENGIHVNRRITGGGAIYFDEESVGWEIVASKSDLPPYVSVESLFRVMCNGAVKALEKLGVRAAFRPKNDIEVEGRKISGTGGTERGEAILFQGTLLVDFDVETMIKALRIPVVKLKDKEIQSVRERVTCLSWELGYKPTYEEVKRCLVGGFEEAMGIELREAGLLEEEERMLREKLPYFQSDDWVFLDRRSSEEPSVLYSIAKKPGGLVRVALTVDREAGIIKSLLVTGDFFAFPPRVIYDLEAFLKFSPCSEEEIRGRVKKFFETRGECILGVSPDDIADLIIEAAGKLSYERYGLRGDELNYIFPVTKKAWMVPLEEYDYLLLPYCAKHIECSYRRIEGCEKCGACSIGDAYRMAEEAGLTPITIQNFEHLMEVLRLMKERNMKGFVGCCCEAFYQKHRDELEAMGVPGIIITIDDKTCYELGKSEEAYRGNFEAQTRIKLDTLSKIIGSICRFRCGGGKPVEAL